MIDRLLVLDLELSCWLGRPPEGMRNDIIEIGFCILDTQGLEILHKRSLIVKPETSIISPYCKELTGISQEMADEGISFKAACDIMRDEYGTHLLDSAAWGPEDAGFLKLDCAHYDASYPLGLKHSNAQKQFKNHTKMKSLMSVRNALSHLGHEFIGQQHRAVDDAYNTAVILSSIIKANPSASHGRQ